MGDDRPPERNEILRRIDDDFDRRIDARLRGFINATEVERRIDAKVRLFLTADEIERRIHKFSAQRWWSVSVPLSPDPAMPGDLEKDASALFAYIRLELEREKLRATNPFRVVVAIAAILGGISGFVGIMIAVLSHVKWS